MPRSHFILWRVVHLTSAPHSGRLTYVEYIVYVRCVYNVVVMLTISTMMLDDDDLNLDHTLVGIS